MISQDLKKQLFKNPVVIKHLGELADMRSATATNYIELAQLISLDVYGKALKDKDTMEQIREPKKKSDDKKSSQEKISGIISGPTLKSLLDDQDKRGNKHVNRSKSLNALLIFLGIPKLEWETYINVNDDHQGQLKFKGDWYLYRYHYTNSRDKIKRTLIKILPGTGGLMTVQYRALNDRVLTGTAQLRGRILTITINQGHQDTKTIEITASIASEDTEVVIGNVFNAIIRSSRNTESYCKHTVMEYIGYDVIKIEDDNIHTVYHSSRPPAPGQETNYDIIDPASDPIVEFLARKNRELAAKPFKRPLIDEIANRNMIAISNERPGYDSIKKILDQGVNWYSISPIDNGSGELACNYFKFEYHDDRKEVTFKCWRYENGFSPFEGYVEYFRNQLVFKTSKKNWKAYQNNSILFYSVGISNPQTQRIYASTTLVIGTENLNRNLKEIFFSSETELKENHNYKYDEFINEILVEKKLISNFEMHALIKMNNMYAEWPTIDKNILLNFNDIKKYAYTYLAFIVNGYSDGEKSLLQIKLQIDQLGFTTEEAVVQYTDSSEQVNTTYTGIASLWKKTLKLRNKMVGGQKSEYIFRIDNIDDTDVSVLEGVATDTDRYGLPVCDRVFAVRYDKLVHTIKNTFKAESEIIKEDSESFKALDGFLKERTGMDIKTYFFEKHRSLREDRRLKK